MNKMELAEYRNNVDLNGPIPVKEPERQYYFIARLKQYVETVKEELGRVPTCCVTTFGCPMVIVTQKCGNPLFI